MYNYMSISNVYYSTYYILLYEWRTKLFTTRNGHGHMVKVGGPLSVAKVSCVKIGYR